MNGSTHLARLTGHVPPSGVHRFSDEVCVLSENRQTWRISHAFPSSNATVIANKVILSPTCSRNTDSISSLKSGCVIGVQSCDFGRMSSRLSLIARCHCIGRNAVHKYISNRTSGISSTRQAALFAILVLTSEGSITWGPTRASDAFHEKAGMSQVCFSVSSLFLLIRMFFVLLFRPVSSCPDKSPNRTSPVLGLHIDDSALAGAGDKFRLPTIRVLRWHCLASHISSRRASKIDPLTVLPPEWRAL